MKRRLLFSLLGAITACSLTMVLVLRGEDTPPPAPAAPVAEQPAAQPPAPTTTVESPAPPAVEPAPAPAATASTAAPAAPAAQPAAATSAAPAAEPAAPALRRLDAAEGHPAAAPAEPDRTTRRHGRHGRASMGGQGDGRVTFFHDTVVEKDEQEQAAVSIFGSTTVDGHASDAAVSVMGNTTVNGSVGDAAVSVMGTTTVNGTAGDAAVAVGGDVVVNGHVHDVVSVGGNVKLGPNAVVDGDLVVVGGVLEQDPSAAIHGHVQRVRLPAISWVFAWVRSALFKGRLLSFDPAASWAWVVAFIALGFYLLLALVFPRGLTKCVETLEQRPGYVVLTALVMTLGMPIIFLLLALTGFGVVVIPVLGAALLVARLLGRATMMAWIGRRFTGTLGANPSAQIALSVLIGGLVVMGFYLIPLVAFLVTMLIGWLGLGTVVYTLLLSMRRNGAKPAPSAPAAGAPGSVAPAVTAAVVGAPPVVIGVGAAVPVPPVVAAPPVSWAMLPRAGFWIRVAASLLDAILLSVAAAMVHLASLFLLLFAAYCIVLWALKGTTIGGIICGLKLVRLDDRPIDWTVAVVRGLAGFLSLAVLGLGFLWVAFDDEKQSWHDKIAGTTIVKMPKGVSLI